MERCCTGGEPGLLQQVSHFWSMLDDLCEKQPEVYRSFIEKQMKNGEELRKAPELHSSVRADMLEPNKGFLYVNICTWKRVPAAESRDKPLPMCGGTLETGTDGKQDLFTILDVALNPASIQGCNKSELKQVYMLALSFAQQQHGMTLSQHYTVVKGSPKSCSNDLNRRLGFQMWPNTSMKSNAGPQTPTELLQQFSSLGSEQEYSEAQIAQRPVEHMKKNLIQVISSTCAEPQQPQYQLEVKPDINGAPCSLCLTVELPKVCSMSECQLSVSKSDILLEVEEVYHLLLEFPKTINEDTASAIFKKKERKLIVTADIL
ncbi:PIH1 domain-containing protein 2 [Gouania willdenowi]|uniref:PIH1 domain-containing protein 2 n=1 Tax=Gouania willdenowi TaxID=441366 RepID=UPI0010553FB8|nr:PIH1 domain-containing protein 2 [Gouania willdenowi]